MKFSIPFFFVITLLFIFSCENKPAPVTQEETSFSEKRLTELSNRMVAYLPQIPVDSMQIPRSIRDGNLRGTKSKSWTSGFFPATLWELYSFSKENQLKNAAIQWQSFVEKEKYDGGTHDLGFKIYCPFGNAYKITKEEKYKNVFVTAAKTLSTRYNEKVGAIRSWDHHADVWNFPVIIDNMMNLEMMFEATNYTGDSSFYKIADQHAKTTLKNHFRADNSSYHVVSYNPETGEVEKKNTHQGHGHETAWSRGQAWGLYGFATVYRYTKNPIFLEQSKKIAEYIFNHPNLPEDLIPYWDYDAPNIPDEPRDVSAATITASGLFELSKHDPTNAKKYTDWANQILKNLESDKYQLDYPPFLLQHSVGSIPDQFETDSPITYADYFYVEALLRSHKNDKP